MYQTVASNLNFKEGGGCSVIGAARFGQNEQASRFEDRMGQFEARRTPQSEYFWCPLMGRGPFILTDSLRLIGLYKKGGMHQTCLNLLPL